MAATFSHQVDRRLPRRSLLKQEARLSYFDDSSPLATPGFRSGAQSPTGITEALGDALAAGGSTPAIIDEDLAQGESRVKSTRNVETQPPSDSRQNISRQNTNIANGLASYYAIWVGGISAFTLENDLARVFEPFARKKQLLSVHVRRQPRHTLGADDLGFVNFYDEQDAVAAYKALSNGTKIKGKRIKLKPPRRKFCNMTQLAEYQQSSIIRDRRPNQNIPITTKSVHAPSDRLGYGSKPRRENLLTSKYQKQIANVTRYLSALSLDPLSLNEPWIGRPRDVLPYYVENLTFPAGDIKRLDQERRINGGERLVNMIQKGMRGRMPFISYTGLPAWVPPLTLPRAIEYLRCDQEPVPMLVIVGKPKKGDTSLDRGVLQAIASIKHKLFSPATPLLPAKRIGRPPYRPLSYLIMLNPKCFDNHYHRYDS